MRRRPEIEFVSVVMRIDSLSNLPHFLLPAPFSIRTFVDGDERSWAEIESLAGEFTDRSKALQHHQKEFGGKVNELRHRCFFLLDPTGKPIGTATAWYNSDFLGGGYGRLHWVAIVPEWQGKNLAKPLVSAAMRELALHHDRVYLTTQTTSHKAIKIYLDFGFRPYIVDESEQRGWALLAETLGNPALAQWSKP